MKSSVKLLALLAAASGAVDAQMVGPNPNAHAGIFQIEPFIGRWEMISFDKQPNGQVTETRSTSHAFWILDGYAVQDDFRALSGSGSVIFRGTSIRTYDPQTDTWLIRWLMVGDPGMTDIRARWVDGRMIGEGTGTDYRGEFRERFEYRFPDPDHYVFTMDRSYDGGTTWIEAFNRIEATRVN